MRTKRMFSNAIVRSDVFLDLPLSTQALYFHLVMEADDEGFVGNPKRTQKLVGASDEDMQNLIDKRYILTFPSGIIVIKHWYVHNYIPKDRYTLTTYTEEKKTLTLDDKNAYTEKNKASKRTYKVYTEQHTDCIQDNIQDVCQTTYEVYTQNKLNEIKRNNIKENVIKENEETPTHNDFLSINIPSIQEIKSFFKLKEIKTDPQRFYNYYSALGWKLGNTPIENWQALALEWNRKDLMDERLKTGFTQRPKSNVEGFGTVTVTDDEL